MTKICRVCQTEHSLDLFPKNENRCKRCRADYDRQYYLKNPEKHAAHQKRYNDKNLQLLYPRDNLSKSNKLDWTLKKSGHIS